LLSKVDLKKSLTKMKEIAIIEYFFAYINVLNSMQNEMLMMQSRFLFARFFYVHPNGNAFTQISWDPDSSD